MQRRGLSNGVAVAALGVQSSNDSIGAKPAHLSKVTTASRIKRQVSPTALALLIVVAQLLVMFLFACAKQGFFVDELWSYGLANSLYFPHLFGNHAMDNAWLTPQTLHSYLEVDPGEQFRFDSVVYNMSNDAHPPLFFLVLHFISSLFPGTFSKWYGIVPNMVYFAISAFLLYRIASKMLGSGYKALLPLLWWGFCPGTISLVIFIRMYMMASMFVLLILNIHYDILVESDTRPAKLVELVCACFLAFMCHYFMYLIAFFLGVVSCLYLLGHKRWKAFALYASVMVLGVLLAFAAFPATIHNLLGNGYSQQGTAKHSMSDIIGRLIGFYSATDSDLFAGVNIAQTIVLALTMVGAIGYLVANRGQSKKMSRGWFVLCLIAASMLFFALVSVVAPWFSSRYVCFIYPLAIVSASWAIDVEIKFTCGNRQTIRTAAYVVLGIVTVAGSVISYPSCVEYIYPEESANLQVMEENHDSESLLISSNYYKVVVKALEIEQIKGIWATTANPDALSNAVSQIDPSDDSFIAYVDPGGNGGESAEQVLDQAIAGTRFDGYRLLPGYTSSQNDGTNLVAYEIYDDAA